MKNLFTIAFLILSIGIANSQILDKSYNYILSSLQNPDAVLINKTKNSIAIKWFDTIHNRYFFNDKNEMYLLVSVTSRFSAETDENLLLEFGKYKLVKSEVLNNSLKYCKVYYDSSDDEYTGYYQLDDNVTVVVTAHSVEEVFDAIKQIAN